MTQLTQTARVVRYLREHPGCTIAELTRGLDPFVANPRARISDARKDGHEIVCRRVDGVNRFYIDPSAKLTLFGDAA